MDPGRGMSARAAVVAGSIALLAVLAAGAWLTFPGLGDKTLVFYDEGQYASEADRFLAVGRALGRIREFRGQLRTTGFRGITLEQREVVAREARQGLDVQYAKPLHPMLLAAGFALAGREPRVAFVLSATFYLMCIVMVYFCGSRAKDAWAGIFASLFLATSTLFVFYARTAYAETQATLFMTSVIYLCCRDLDDPRAWRAPIAGFLFGIALAIGYRPVVCLPLLAGLEGMRALGWLGRSESERPWRESLRRGLMFVAAAAVPLLAIELFYHVILIISARYDVFLVHKTYLEALLERLLGETGRAITINRQPFQFTRLLPGYELWPFLSLILAGAYLALKQASATWRGLTLVALGWFVGWDVVSYQHHIHLIVPILPVLALLAGLATSTLIARAGSKGVAAGGLLFALLLPWGAWNAHHGQPPASGYRELLRHLHANGIQRIVTTQPRVFGFYLGQDNIRSEVRTPAELEQAFRDGYTHYVICVYRFSIGIGMVGENTVEMLEKYCRERAEPTLIPDAFPTHELIWHDHSLLSSDPAKVEVARQIRVYDLARVFATH